MDGDPADVSLIDLMLGDKVVIEYLAGPMTTDDNFDQVVDEG
jgi:hypothetical protein